MTRCMRTPPGPCGMPGAFEWYYYDEPDLYDGQRVTLIYDDGGTPDDLADDVLVDILAACPADSHCHED